MKSIRFLILFPAFMLFAVVQSGCFLGEKSKAKKVDGTWQMLNTWDYNVTNAEDEYWRFTDNNFDYLVGLPPVIRDSAKNYFIQQKLSKAFLTIDYDDRDSKALAHGTWEIIKLNKTEMILQKTDGGKILREFIRDEDQ